MMASLAHLKWGLYRLYVDALLYFGNIRTAFRSLRDLAISDLETFFRSQRFDTGAVKRRVPPLPLNQIAKDSRFQHLQFGLSRLLLFAQFRHPAAKLLQAYQTFLIGVQEEFHALLLPGVVPA